MLRKKSWGFCYSDPLVSSPVSKRLNSRCGQKKLGNLLQWPLSLKSCIHAPPVLGKKKLGIVTVAPPVSSPLCKRLHHRCWAKKAGEFVTVPPSLKSCMQTTAPPLLGKKKLGNLLQWPLSLKSCMQTATLPVLGKISWGICYSPPPPVSRSVCKRLRYRSFSKKTIVTPKKICHQKNFFFLAR